MTKQVRAAKADSPYILLTGFDDKLESVCKKFPEGTVIFLDAGEEQEVISMISESGHPTMIICTERMAYYLAPELKKIGFEGSLVNLMYTEAPKLAVDFPNHQILKLINSSENDSTRVRNKEIIEKFIAQHLPKKEAQSQSWVVKSTETATGHDLGGSGTHTR